MTGRHFDHDLFGRICDAAIIGVLCLFAAGMAVPFWIGW